MPWGPKWDQIPFANTVGKFLPRRFFSLNRLCRQRMKMGTEALWCAHRCTIGCSRSANRFKVSAPCMHNLDQVGSRITFFYTELQKYMAVQYWDLTWTMPLVKVHIHTHEQCKFHLVIGIFNVGKKSSITDLTLLAFSPYSFFINGCWISKWHLELRVPVASKDLLANKANWFLGGSL